MADTNITNTATGDISSVIKDYSVDSISTDSAGDQKETEWINSNWSQQLGYYKKIPELTVSVDAKATWTVGKGFIADEDTTLIIDQIKGFGKDTFNTILENAIRTYHIGGDAFLEIIKDNEKLINLKPLDPSRMKIIANKKGIIKRYEQVGNNKPFKVDQILHFSRNRIADEIHGVSMIDAVEEIILMRNEAMADYRKLLHRNVYPVRIWHLDTDVPSKILAFKAKVATCKSEHEDIFIPKGAVETEIAAVPSNSTLNPLPWIRELNQYFFQATGVPQIIVGGSSELTEASCKISYLAFQQTIEEEQLYIEEQVGLQLGLTIELEFPASLENEMLSDKPKVEGNEIENEKATQPNDTTTEMEGNK